MPAFGGHPLIQKRRFFFCRSLPQSGILLDSGGWSSICLRDLSGDSCLEPAGGVAVDDAVPGGPVNDRLNLGQEFFSILLAACRPDFLEGLFQPFFLFPIAEPTPFILPGPLQG